MHVAHIQTHIHTFTIHTYTHIHHTHTHTLTQHTHVHTYMHTHTYNTNTYVQDDIPDGFKLLNGDEFLANREACLQVMDAWAICQLTGECA
jgi:hypothetical protein